MGFFWTIVVLVIALGITWRYLGSYMAAVFDGRVHFLGWAERPFYRLLGTGPDARADLEALRRLAGDLLRRRSSASATCCCGSKGRCRSTRSTSGPCRRRSASTRSCRS